ncbi:MAG: FlgD immunoglobulin-like domain containing protein [bacterium]
MFKTTGFSVGGAQENPNLNTISEIRLSLNPNPFKQYIEISYQLSHSAQVSLRIYDLSGREVAELVNQNQPAGSYQLNWDGKTDQGYQLNSGVFFYRLNIDDQQLIGRIVKIN